MVWRNLQGNVVKKEGKKRRWKGNRSKFWTIFLQNSKQFLIVVSHKCTAILPNDTLKWRNVYLVATIQDWISTCGCSLTFLLKIEDWHPFPHKASLPVPLFTRGHHSGWTRTNWHTWHKFLCCMPLPDTIRQHQIHPRGRGFCIFAFLWWVCSKPLTEVCFQQDIIILRLRAHFRWLVIHVASDFFVLICFITREAKRAVKEKESWPAN